MIFFNSSTIFEWQFQRWTVWHHFKLHHISSWRLKWTLTIFNYSYRAPIVCVNIGSESHTLNVQLAKFIHHENTLLKFWSPYTQLLCSKTGVYRDVHYFSYFYSKTYIQSIFWSRNNENYQNFSSESFHFSGGKILNIFELAYFRNKLSRISMNLVITVRLLSPRLSSYIGEVGNMKGHHSLSFHISNFFYDGPVPRNMNIGIHYEGHNLVTQPSQDTE